jgi:hypothetical protein
VGSSSRHSIVWDTGSAAGITERLLGATHWPVPSGPGSCTSIRLAARAVSPREAGTCTTARSGKGAYKVISGLPGTARSPASLKVCSTQPS